MTPLHGFSLRQQKKKPKLNHTPLILLFSSITSLMRNNLSTKMNIVFFLYFSFVWIGLFNQLKVCVFS